jgi:hypothetical protein
MGRMGYSPLFDMHEWTVTVNVRLDIARRLSMTTKKAKIRARKNVHEDESAPQSVPPDVLQIVGIESHDPATCTCEECVAIRLNMGQQDRKAA